VIKAGKNDWVMDKLLEQVFFLFKERRSLLRLVGCVFRIGVFD